MPGSKVPGSDRIHDVDAIGRPGAAPRHGTQSLERAVVLLRAIASHGRRGMRIADVVAVAGLPQSTCSRMLQCLLREGLAWQDPHTRKFFVGPLVHELALVARPPERLDEACRPALEQLAETTGDTVYLSERSGFEALCTARVLGDYPIKALSLDVGVRRPLGVGAGGLAMLAAMPVDEAEAIVQAIGPRYEAHGGWTAAAMHAAVAQARRDGHACIDGVVTRGSVSIGVALPGLPTRAAVSVAAISGRLDAERRVWLARLIRRELEALPALRSAGGRVDGGATAAPCNVQDVTR